MDAIPAGALPQTPQEVRGLQERREILRDQLDRATNRREQLVNELNGENGQTLGAEARVGVQQRLQVLDERIIQLERDQAATERLLSNAPAAVLAQTAEPRDVGGRVDEDEAVGVAFATFGLGIVLTLVVGRVRRALVRRRGGPVAAAQSVADDPRIDRLAHTVEAIAEEVERIGEGQRFVTQLLASQQQRETAALAGRVERP